MWGYKDWVRATSEEGRWDNIEWGEDGKLSGAQAVEKCGNKLVYKY